MPETMADPKTIRDLADQIEEIDNCPQLVTRRYECMLPLLKEAIAHGAFSGPEFRTMHLAMDTVEDQWFMDMARMDECRDWLRTYRDDLDDDQDEWSCKIIVSALRDEADKMADAPKVGDQTSTDDQDIAANDMAAPTIISAAVACQRYEVNAQTIGEAVRDGKLADHRPDRHAKNAPHRLDEREVANSWRKR